ncbi:MAG: hypothetical protein E6K71_10130 [Candidatus Eisenbacteria bacterium]|uniref:GTA TIM-barrel-like domain-containing protein n=1 Tax=Eiseniibacteriota bacterium TaxID=2212470 RepID=A0A538S7P3_UNCEI|nr:MAG: hypothetical protein E6K71_10130 [Candidatus Eisenbacteria bacterium]
MAALLITLLGAVAGAILVPQELARRDAQPIPTHSPMHRKPPRAGAAGAARTLPFARGVCWEAAGEIDSTDLDPLLRIRANWISQTPFGWQRGPDTPEIRGSYEGAAPQTRPPRDARRYHGFWGERDEGVLATTRWAHARGIRVLLKPHIWTRGGWSGSIAMKNEEDWARWFAGYREFILHYADLAERSGAEALAVGTELGGTTAREREWRAIVAEVRRHYHGTLVYCANWAEDLHHTQFWDALDWIGVQAYYPLCDQRAPTTQALVRGWSGPLADLETIAKIWGKPVVLTEVGYHSLDTAAIRPWEWDLPGSLSMETQARCYEALFQAVSDHPVVHGVFIWKWHPDYSRAGGPGDTEYSPQRKPAEAVLARGYAAIERQGI